MLTAVITAHLVFCAPNLASDEVSHVPGEVSMDPPPHQQHQLLQMLLEQTAVSCLVLVQRHTQSVVMVKQYPNSLITKADVLTTMSVFLITWLVPCKKNSESILNKKGTKDIEFQLD